MTKTLTKLLAVAFLVTGLQTAQAQFNTDDLGDLGTIFNGGQQDAELYFNNYFRPAILSFGNGLAGGWVNTAKPHKLLGFDLTVSMNLAAIPKEDATFNFNSAGFQNLILASGDPNLPTLAGSTSDAVLEFTSPTIDGADGVEIDYTGDTQFAAPGGLNLDFLYLAAPVPTVNAGIGLIKNTDLKVRFIPTVGTDDFELSLWGVGVLHDVKQHIPGLKLVPIDISAFVGYTKMNMDVAVTTEPGDDFQAEDGLAEFEVSSTTIQVVASKKLAIFTPYASVGYNIVDNSFKTSGRFFYTNDLGATVDFANLDVTYSGASTTRLTAGFQLKLAILTLHADYTIQKYNTLTAGVGISVR